LWLEKKVIFSSKVTMADKELNNHAPEQVPKNRLPATGKRHSRPLWIIFLVFFVLVATVFLTRDRETIDWIEDYEVAVNLAEQKNKSLLLAFYKVNTRFCSDMSQDTYNNADVIKFVEENFVPVLIDVDKQPEIAERYRVAYYPTHYIKRPDSDKLIGPHVGYDIPSEFIRKLKALLAKMNPPPE
jgi:hypothetical protein